MMVHGINGINELPPRVISFCFKVSLLDYWTHNFEPYHVKICRRAFLPRSCLCVSVWLAHCSGSNVRESLRHRHVYQSGKRNVQDVTHGSPSLVEIQHQAGPVEIHRIHRIWNWFDASQQKGVPRNPENIEIWTGLSPDSPGAENWDGSPRNKSRPQGSCWQIHISMLKKLS